MAVTPTHSPSYQQLVARAGTTISEIPQLRTQSGNSLGSVGHYSMDWNAADASEVSSPNPVGPSQVVQSIHALHVAVLNASKITEVNLPQLSPSFFFNKT